MKRLLTGAMFFTLVMGLAGVTQAADGAAIFKSKCLACHGPDGKGTAMAPALQSNAFIKDSEADVIAKTIKDGRAGAAKRYKNFALSMPAQKGSMSDDDISAVIKYLKSIASK